MENKDRICNNKHVCAFDINFGFFRHLELFQVKSVSLRKTCHNKDHQILHDKKMC